MPRFEAQVWVSGEHPYQVETNAANVFAAKEIIARREGVKEHEVQRVFQKSMLFEDALNTVLSI